MEILQEEDGAATGPTLPPMADGRRRPQQRMTQKTVHGARGARGERIAQRKVGAQKSIPTCPTPALVSPQEQTVQHEREIVWVKETVESAATRRRLALTTVMADRQLTIVQLTKLAGIQSPSTIANFLAGESNSLNLSTLEPVARVLGVSINRLIGEPMPTREVVICGAVATNRWRRHYLWPRSAWTVTKTAIDVRDYGLSYFFHLETEEMNAVYQKGTLLELVNLENYKGKLDFGNRVIIVRTNTSGYVEISCRELVADGEAGCLAVARSTDSSFDGKSLPFSWPIEPGSSEVTPNGDRIEVRAVVVRVIFDEIAKPAKPDKPA